MTAGAKKPTKGMDLAVLQKMVEPIGVRVEKIKGHSRQPVSLPGKDGSAPGTGWVRDDVLEMERYVQSQEGGGYYEAKVTDSNGTTMEWPFGWDPRVIPEKVSPTDQPYAAMPSMAAPMQPGQQIPLQPNPMQSAAPLGYGGQSWLAQQAQPPYPYAPQYPTQQPQQPQQQTWGMNPWGMPAMPSQWPFGGGASTPIASSNKEDNARMRQLEERLAAAERDNQAKEYQAQLERQRAESAAQINVLRDELRRIGEAKLAGPDPEVVRAREENERLRREAELRDLRTGFQDQINILRTAMEKALTQPTGESDEIRRLREEQKRAEDRAERMAMEQRHREELRDLKESINKGPDPMLAYLTENSRQQAEIAKEIARAQEKSAISPIQVMDMIQKQSGGMDGLVKSIIGSFGGAFETYRMMMESLVQMNGGGQSPTQAMLQQGIDRASDIANQYIAFQRDKTVHESKAKAAAVQAQAQMQAAQAALVAQQRRAQQQPSQPPHGYDAGLASAGPTPDQISPSNGANGHGEGAEVIDINDRRPPTEEEMFGPALESVQHLRKGVEAGNLRPDQAVEAVIQGVAVCEQQGVKIPAFALFAEGRFADLIDVLLPKATQQFRDACVGVLYQRFESEEEGEGEGDEDQPS